MNLHDNDEYHRMIEEHLSLLTTYGIEFVGTQALAAVALLEHDLFGKDSAIDPQLKETFELLKSSLTKYDELVKWSLNERKRLAGQPGDS